LTGPLAPITSEQKLTRVAEAAWGLTALICDVDWNASPSCESLYNR
jgi:hypothetical protein